VRTYVALESLGGGAAGVRFERRVVRSGSADGRKPANLSIIVDLYVLGGRNLAGSFIVLQ